MFNKKLSILVFPLMTQFLLQANDPFNDPFYKDPFGDNIFKEMMQMQKSMDEMFQRMHNRMEQRNNSQIAPLGTYKIQQQNTFVDKGDHYVFESAIPESKENQIDINTQDGVMSITAKIIEKQENKTSSGYSTSSSMRMYQQSMPLPTDADESTINMAYENGKLVVSVKKKKSKNVGKALPVKTELQKDENKTNENNTSVHKIKLDDRTSMS